MKQFRLSLYAPPYHAKCHYKRREWQTTININLSGGNKIWEEGVAEDLMLENPDRYYIIQSIRWQKKKQHIYAVNITYWTIVSMETMNLIFIIRLGKNMKSCLKSMAETSFLLFSQIYSFSFGRTLYVTDYY